jgi:uncharacterized protein
MNYLITGGTGTIGINLINELNQPVNNISVLTRNKENAEKLFPKNIKLITDITLSEINDADVIINLAGEPIAKKRWTSTQKNKICQSRWQITEHIATLIGQSEFPPSLFISGSAIGVYGRQNNSVIDEEFTNYHEEFSHHLCSNWESLALSAQSPKTRVVILRTGIVLNRNSGALKEMSLPFQLGLGGKMGSGRQMMSWIHIKDVVEAIIHIERTKELIGPINITAGSAVSNQVFTQVFAKVLHRPCLLTTPSIIIRCAFGEMSDLLLYGQNVKPKKLLTSGFQFKFTDLSSALENLYNKV